MQSRAGGADDAAAQHHRKRGAELSGAAAEATHTTQGYQSTSTATNACRAMPVPAPRRTGWLGREDSNLRMVESKSADYPNKINIYSEFSRAAARRRTLKRDEHGARFFLHPEMTSWLAASAKNEKGDLESGPMLANRYDRRRQLRHPAD